MDEVEKFPRIDAVLAHQAPQSRAVFMEKPLLQGLCLRQLEIEMLADELPHPPFDLGKEVAGRWIERVVEIEQPDLYRVTLGQGPVFWCLSHRYFSHDQKVDRGGTEGKPWKSSHARNKG